MCKDAHNLLSSVYPTNKFPPTCPVPILLQDNKIKDTSEKEKAVINTFPLLLHSGLQPGHIC